MKVLYNVIIMFTIGQMPTLGSENSFDQAIQNLRNTKPELFEEKNEVITSKTAAVDDSFYESLDKTIDAIALTSALIRMYHRYYSLNRQTNDENSTLNTVLSYMMPSFIPSLHTKIVLIKEASIITIETIIYKTIAKMLIYCAKGDAYDLAKKILCKIKAIIINPMI